MQVFISVDGVLGNAMVMDFPDVAIVCTFVFLVMNQPAVLSRTRLRILHPLPAALKLHTTTAPLPISGHAPPPQRPSGSECTAQPRCPSQRPAPPSPVPPGGGASARRSAMAAAAFCSPCSALRSGLAPLCRWRALPHPASRRAGSVPRSAARYGTPPFSSSFSLLLLLALPEGRGGPARPCPALPVLVFPGGPSPPRGGWGSILGTVSVFLEERALLLWSPTGSCFFPARIPAVVRVGCALGMLSLGNKV